MTIDRCSSPVGGEQWRAQFSFLAKICRAVLSPQISWVATQNKTLMPCKEVAGQEAALLVDIGSCAPPSSHPMSG